MLAARKCEFCGSEFVNADGRDPRFCLKCSGERRERAARHFMEASGRVGFCGDYLLTEAKAAHLRAVRPG